MTRTLLASLTFAGALLGARTADAQNLACPKNPSAASIVQLSCVDSTTRLAPDGVLTNPCRPANGGVMEPRKRTVEVGICSKALNRVVKTRVVLPVDYYSNPSVKPSVLYLFHGANNGSTNLKIESNHDDWGNATTVEALSAGTKTLVVTPEGGPIGWYSDWRTQPKLLENWTQMVPFLQNWETNFFDEVIPLVEARFRNNGARVAAGLSMGGLGAISYAARAPLHGKSFRAAASFSGGLSVKSLPTVVQTTLAIKGIDGDAVWGTPYSSDPAVSQWAEHDPRWLVERLVDMPVWVGSGNGSGNDPVEFGAWGMGTDYANAQDGAINRAKTNNAAQGKPAPRGYVVRDMGDTSAGYANQGCPGKHDWAYWTIAIKRAWPFLRAHLEAAPGVVPPKAGVLAPQRCGDPDTFPAQ